MCDYSLHGIKNRLAVDGEILVVHRFHTGSKGLASAKDPVHLPECAVCIPDGTRLLMTDISPALQASIGVAETEEATFRQFTADEATHRDGLEFRNGKRIRLQDLEEGLLMEVLSLCPDDAGPRREKLNAFIVL